MVKNRIILLLTPFILLLPSFLPAANINIYRGTPTFTAGGGYIIPAGKYTDMVDPGPVLYLSCQYQPSAEFMDTFLWWNWFFFETGFQYTSTAPSDSPASSMTWLSADFGPVLYYPLFLRLCPYIGASAGWHYSILELDETGKTADNNGPVFRGKAGIIIPATSSLSFRIEGTYSYFHLEPTPFTSYGVTLGASYNFSGDNGNLITPTESIVKTANLKLKDIYAIRYKHYNSGGIGTLSIINTGYSPVYNVRIDIDIEGVTSESRSTESIETLSAQETRAVFIPVYITEKIFSITEDSRRTIRFRIVYSTGTSKYYYTENSEIQVFNKNRITWDKTERLGSFIMPRDATVSSFSRRAISGVDTTAGKGISKKLISAMVLFDSLNAAGLTYVSDPRNPESGNDYVQLPGETLKKKAGDCDDLTALYASLLEDVGISTAIATIPGHVFLLFNTEVIGSSASEVSDDPRSYLIRGGTVWIPVEVTSIKEGFCTAWKNGSQNITSSDFACVETMKAWEEFPPADNETDYSIDTPDRGQFAKRIDSDIMNLKTILFEQKADVLKKNLTDDCMDYKKWNELGIIYGRFYMLDEAEECFSRALSISKDYCPAICNRGNIAMLKKDYESAAAYYGEALAIESENTNILINYARALYELKKYDQAGKIYKKALSKNPGVAARYGYLARSSAENKADERASDITDRIEQNAWLRCE